MKEFLQEYYPHYEHALAAAMLTFAMLGMGAKLAVRDFLTVFKVPKGFTVGMILQVIIVPLVAWLMIRFVPDMPVGIAVGIALVAAMPGGSASNIFTHLGKGNAALSVAMTCGATLTCLVTTPIVFKLLAPLQDTELEMPYVDVIREIFFFLLIPLAVGMVVNRIATEKRDAFSKWNVRLSLFMVLVIIVGSVGAGRIDMKAFGVKGILLTFGFAIAAQQVSLWTTAAFRFPGPDRLAIIIEITIRNTLLALLLYSSVFNKTVLAANPELEAIARSAFFVILFYGAAAMLVAVPPLMYYKKRAIQAEEAAEKAREGAGKGADEAGAETEGAPSE